MDTETIEFVNGRNRVRLCFFIGPLHSGGRSSRYVKAELSVNDCDRRFGGLFLHPDDGFCIKIIDGDDWVPVPEEYQQKIRRFTESANKHNSKVAAIDKFDDPRRLFPIDLDV